MNHRLFPSSLVSLWIHGSLLGFLWLPSLKMWEDMVEAEEGAQAGAEVIAGQAAVTTLPPLDPLNLTPVTITIEDPANAPDAPAALPATASVAPGTPTHHRASTEDAPTDAVAVRPDATAFHASGGAGEGADRSGKKKPCEPKEGISPAGEGAWTVERSIVDYYAAHVPELDRQVGSETHLDADHRPDGLKIFLSRCSILKQVGIRNGDIVHTINGIKVHSIVQAIAIWFKLRDVPHIQVELTRKEQPKTLSYEVIK